MILSFRTNVLLFFWGDKMQIVYIKFPELLRHVEWYKDMDTIFINSFFHKPCEAGQVVPLTHS